MRHGIRWATLALLLVGLAAWGDEPAETDELARRETSVWAALRDFWTASAQGEPRALRDAVGLPLTLLEQQPADQPAQPPFVVTEDDWPAFVQGMPAVPLLEQEVILEFGNLRLEWLDPLTCLASYDLAVTLPESGWAGHFATVTRFLEERWRVVVTSIPGEG